MIAVLEPIESMKRKTGEVGAMVIKVDLEEAYDRVNWNFLQSVVRAADLSKNLVKLIMHCIRSIKLSILWNREKLDPIKPQR